MNTKVHVVIVGGVLLVLGLGVGYMWGDRQAYSRGYQKAAADVKTAQEEVAKKAGEEAAKAVNPFQATNPLEGVNANPFKDAAQKLNPFAQ